MSARITDPITLGTLSLRNRLYRAPVLEGAGSAPNPTAVYMQHFVPNVEAGLGLVIQGNTIVLPEGRTSPGMSVIGERARMLALAPLTRGVHEAGGKIVIQLGHGGLFALEGWHRQFAPGRSAPPLAASLLPVWMRALHRGDTTVLSTAEVERLAQRFGIVAAWAREAGYDGVQLAGSNSKLLHQFLSPFFNRRKDRYGGDVYGRTTFIREIKAAIAREAGADFPVLLKYTAVEETSLGRGITLEDGVEIARIAQDAGFVALPNSTICRGDFPAQSFENAGLRKRLLSATGSRLRSAVVFASMWIAARKYPFKPVWNRDVFAAVKSAVTIPVFAVGGIRTPQEAAEILARGQADMIGIGRPFYAEPELAARFLAEGGSFELGVRTSQSTQQTACESCNRCIVPQMLGMPGVCYNPQIHKIRKRRPSERKVQVEKPKKVA
jgi:2,4-dienoyl-CoA reductase-like NADH-dependent reductase (Old Yellow Enzyme family)